MRRLKFKYLELEAKLIFLGSITTDEPQTALDDQIFEAGAAARPTVRAMSSLTAFNPSALERTNAIKKQTLKATKLQAHQIRDEAVEIGRSVEQCTLSR